MKDWERDKQRADLLLADVQRILGAVFVSPAPMKADMQEATDLVVLTVAPYTVAWRNRTPLYRERYPFDVTIRAGRPTGMKTELAKFTEGWGQFFLYTFGEAPAPIAAWVLIDLNKFRCAMIHDRDRAWGKTWRRRDNGDKSSWFYALDTRNRILEACVHATSANYWVAVDADQYSDEPPPDIELPTW